MSYYQKYRSKNFDEVVGQSHVTDILKNAVKKSKTSHAYLFTGPRGVGKTSVARILAHQINKKDYDGLSPTDIDIIEIDAASHGSVDHVRELREKAYIYPVSSPKKVYIIDEVHMLSTAAFNALLKLIEEPPEHLVFILATTEAHKVPETITSRAQRFTFREISKADTAKQIQHIAKLEKLKIDEDAIQIIADRARGSLRDALSILQQLSDSGNDISKKLATEVLGLADDKTIQEFNAYIQSGRLVDLSQAYRNFIDQGGSVVILSEQLSRFWLDQIINGQNTIPTQDLSDAIHKIANLSQRSYMELVILTILINLASTNLNNDTPEVVPVPPQPIPEPTKPKEPEVKKKTASEDNPVVIKESQPIPEAAQELEPVPASTSPKSTKPKAVWTEILKISKKQSTSLHSLLRMARMSLENNSMQIFFHYPFHLRQAQDSKNFDTLQKIASEALGDQVELRLALDSMNNDTINKVTDKIVDVIGGEQVQML